MRQDPASGGGVLRRNGWQAVLDASSGRFYFFDERTRETSWTAPLGWGTPPRPAATAPSLYACDNDLREAEPVDERVNAALEELNAAGEAVNEAEASLSKARRGLVQLEADQQAACQAQYLRLSRAARDQLPLFLAKEQARVRQADAQRAFVAAGNAHASAKEAMEAMQSRMLALSGDPEVDIDFLAQCSDLGSRVVLAESAKVRADHAHAVEARRVSALMAELGRSSRDASIRAQAYVAFKATAEASVAQQAQLSQAREEAAKAAKRRYADALRSLELISMDVHEQRAVRQGADAMTSASAAHSAD